MSTAMPRMVATTCVFLLCFLIKNVGGVSDRPLVLLVVYDGLRWDYLDMVRSHRPDAIPNFDALIRGGVYADHVINVFPTDTMPTHMTMQTGLYTETHGVVGNNFYDPILKKWFFFMKGDGNEDSDFFDNGGEPIWVTNQRASPDRHTGAALFPCTLAAIKGVNVTYRMPGKLFTPSVPYETRVDAMLSWFTDPVAPINLGLFYYDEPDLIGHDFGPGSNEILEIVIKLDNLTGYLMKKLEERGLRDKINLIFTSDHGMSQLDPNKTINIADFLPLGKLIITGRGFTPNPGFEELVYNSTKAMQQAIPQIKFFLKNDTSAEVRRLRYSNNARTPSIILLADADWTVTVPGLGQKEGSHLFDPSQSDMWPYFIATGPAFRKNFRTKEIHQIDLYELMCHILEIRPAPNHGSFNRIRRILKRGGRKTRWGRRRGWRRKFRRRPRRKPGRRPRRKPGRRPRRKPGRSPRRKPGRGPRRKPGRGPRRKPGRRPRRKQGRRPQRRLGRRLWRKQGRKLKGRPAHRARRKTLYTVR